MKRASALLSSIAAVAMVLGLALGAAGATPGGAVYSVQFSSGSSSHSYTVTETVSSGSNASLDTLFLAVASGSWNVTYSRSVNSSLVLQPFLPAISNQTFTSSYNGTAVSASIERSGSSQLPFDGQSYTMTNYAYDLQVTGQAPSLGGMNLSAGMGPGSFGSFPSTGSNFTATLTGSISTFPSGLVYSVSGSSTGAASFSITLLSTTLPLDAGTASTTAQVASLGVGAGAVVSALALGLGVRHRRHQDSAPEKKPDHWVD